MILSPYPERSEGPPHSHLLLLFWLSFRAQRGTCFSLAQPGSPAGGLCPLGWERAPVLPQTGLYHFDNARSRPTPTYTSCNSTDAKIPARNASRSYAQNSPTSSTDPIS